MRFSIDDRVVTMQASVVRAAVVHVHAEEVRYETGLRLCEDLASESLDIGLFERRTEAGMPALPIGEGEVKDLPSDLVFLPGPPALEDAGGPERGWWLAGRRGQRAELFDQIAAP